MTFQHGRAGKGVWEGIKKEKMVSLAKEKGSFMEESSKVSNIPKGLFKVRTEK